MGNLLSSIDKKTLQARPELVTFVKDVIGKKTVFEHLKAQKDEAKKTLKAAEKALKKQLKSKASKQAVAKKAPKPAGKAKAPKLKVAKKAPKSTAAEPISAKPRAGKVAKKGLQKAAA